jgi:Methyltransferase domain
MRSRLDEARERRRFRRAYGFRPPPRWSDTAGHHTLLDAMNDHGVANVDGDVVEIGVFLGGGTYTLSRYLERVAPGKRVYAIDIFQPGFDATRNSDGIPMSAIYAALLGHRDQRAVYRAVTAGCANVVTIVADSMQVALPCDRICFAHIDGNHASAYVRHDFELVWSALSPHGVIALDDYGGDIPSVTRTVHALIADHAGEIDKIETRGERTIVIRRA